MYLIQGIAIGAVTTMFVGFTFGGWATNGTAEKNARRDAKKATIAALTSICVDNFRKQADVEKSLSTLKKISSWQQASFVERGGWATMPGSTIADLGVAQACAQILSDLRLPQ